MSQLIRNKSVTNRPKAVKLIELNSIVLMSDKNEKQKALNELITHLLLYKCDSDKCHDLSDVFTLLATHLIHFQTCDQPIDRLLKDFNLIAVNDTQIATKYLQLICETINLKPFKCNQILDNLLVPKLNGFQQFSNEMQIQSKEFEIFDEMHSSLRQIKISKFQTNLLRSIERKFPFISGPMVSIHSYLCYVYNILKTYDYVSNKEQLMSFTFDKLLWIDSTIASNKAKAYEEVFDFDDCALSKSEQNLIKQKEILDNSMQLLFDFITDKTKDKSTEECEELFDVFKALFSNALLSTQTSNHLQYVWLYLCSTSTQLADQFIQYLWTLGLNTDYSVPKREKSLYFLSSLLKNANFYAINSVISFMNMCSLWINRYIDENDRMPDQITSEDTVFYIICQTLFDTFCSIHLDLDNQSLRRVKVMNIQRIIKSKLNPLAFCCRDVESKFICLARHYQIGYCQQNEGHYDGRLKQPLDPFNNGSYVLPKSRKRIENLCKYSVNSENSLENEIEKFNRFNTSDNESDNMFGSFRHSYSPSKTLWQNLLSDSSPNEHMDCE